MANAIGSLTKFINCKSKFEFSSGNPEIHLNIIMKKSRFYKQIAYIMAKTDLYTQIQIQIFYVGETAFNKSS